MTSLTLVHTNDTHGSMAPQPDGSPSPAALALQRLLEAEEDPLYLDAGDTVRAGNLGFNPSGEAALRELTRLGCAAMCLGNRETHPRKEIFPRKIASAGFPLLCANMRTREGKALPAAPHLLIQRQGVKIGIFGVTVPMFRKEQWSSLLCDYLFDPPLEEAAKQVKLLRDEVDLLIALTHIGHRHDLALAQLCPQIDLVVGGHSHTELQQPVYVGDTAVVQAYAFGFYAGVARLSPGARPALTGWELRPLRPRPSSGSR